jgi:hypothetical protein
MSTTYKSNGSAKITIAHTGQALSLASWAPNGLQSANRVDIIPLAGNGGSIMIGDNTVAADQTNGGILMAVGDTYTIELITCLQVIFVNGTAGDGISINWWIGDRN